MVIGTVVGGDASMVTSLYSNCLRNYTEHIRIRQEIKNAHKAVNPFLSGGGE